MKYGVKAGGGEAEVSAEFGQLKEGLCGWNRKNKGRMAKDELETARF